MLNQEVNNLVINSFQDDEHSSCPGMKDYATVNNVKTKHQKHLLHLNIKELYLEFKKQSPDVKIGFSKFCELRSQWVKTVTNSGMHTVCVCQNVKLLVSAIPTKQDYKEILSKVVCRMIHLS